jgi:hypothetical protein
MSAEHGIKETPHKLVEKTPDIWTPLNVLNWPLIGLFIKWDLTRFLKKQDKSENAHETNG